MYVPACSLDGLALDTSVLARVTSVINNKTASLVLILFVWSPLSLTVSEDVTATDDATVVCVNSLETLSHSSVTQTTSNTMNGLHHK